MEIRRTPCDLGMARDCLACDSRNEMARFENEAFTIAHAGIAATIEHLSGWRCAGCGEIEFYADSAARYAAAGDRLVRHERQRQSNKLRRIRRKLGLSQIDAGRLTGGDHNAFSRQERGEASPLPAVFNLSRLLDKHPELFKDLG